MEDLKTNYVDDVLDSSKNQLRKYQQIQNDDGTVSFVDVTEYSTTGTSFGAKDINDTNAAVNELNNSLNSSNRDYFISVSQSNMNMLNTDNVLLTAEKIALINTQFTITTGANRQILISAKKPTVATPLTVIGSSSWAIATIDTSGLITANTALGAGNYVIIGSFKYK